MAKVRKGDHYYSDFAVRLREQMDAEPKTRQTELAAKIGVSRQTVSQYADGSTQPSPDTLLLIAKYFKVSTDYLVGRVAEPTQNVELQQVCEYTGLTEGAVKTLKSMKANCGDVIHTFNQGLEHQDFIELIRAIHLHSMNSLLGYRVGKGNVYVETTNKKKNLLPKIFSQKLSAVLALSC